MIKKQNIKEQMESYFIANGIKYTYANKIVKNISIPTYILKLRIFNAKTKEVENEISVQIQIFHSAYSIFFEVPIYRINQKKYCTIFKKINLLNRYSLPGKYIINDNNFICYRCIWNYQNYEQIDEKSIKNIIDSILPSYYLCLSKLEKKKDNIIYEQK